MVPQCKYFTQNLTSLPKRAKIVIPRKANEKSVPPAYRKGVVEGEGPLSTLSLSYKAVYLGFLTGVANMGGCSSKFHEGEAGLSENQGGA